MLFVNSCLKPERSVVAPLMPPLGAYDVHQDPVFLFFLRTALLLQTVLLKDVRDYSVLQVWRHVHATVSADRHLNHLILLDCAFLQVLRLP